MIDSIQAKSRLLTAWLQANPNQPMSEGREKVEKLILIIEADARKSVPTDPDPCGYGPKLEMLQKAAERYQAAEWAFRFHEDEPLATKEHNDRVEEWRSSDAALRAVIDWISQ